VVCLYVNVVSVGMKMNIETIFQYRVSFGVVVFHMFVTHVTRIMSKHPWKR